MRQFNAHDFFLTLRFHTAGGWFKYPDFDGLFLCDCICPKESILKVCIGGAPGQPRRQTNDQNQTEDAFPALVHKSPLSTFVRGSIIRRDMPL